MIIKALPTRGTLGSAVDREGMTMRAVVYKRYGPPDVLQLKAVDKPDPGDNEILIRVHATSVTAADYRIRGFKVSPGFWLPARLSFGFFRPRKAVLGAEFAGVVEAVGKDVNLFQTGDQVFGYDAGGFGAYADYLCRSEQGAVGLKPANTTFEEAASIPHGALAALFFLRDKGKIQSGHKVLIYGASGAVGTAAVQLARHFGAQVTGVCSASNLEMVRSLGAHTVIDYTSEDFTRNDETYDIIFDTVGKTSLSRCKRSLKPKGRYLLTVFDVPQLLQMLWTAVMGGKKVICAVASEKREDLIFIRDLVEAGQLKPVIDRRYPLEQIVEAHTYAEKGHKKGSVVIIVTES